MDPLDPFTDVPPTFIIVCCEPVKRPIKAYIWPETRREIGGVHLPSAQGSGRVISVFEPILNLLFPPNSMTILLLDPVLTISPGDIFIGPVLAGLPLIVTFPLMRETLPWLQSSAPSP